MTNAQTESPMAASAGEKVIAAVCDKRGPDAARMEAYLKCKAITAKWYALRDLADLDRDVREGRVGGVVFVRAADLLEGIFNNEIKYSDWVTASVPVSFFESVDGDTARCMANVGEAWDRHQVARRRRQTVAGIILGIIAIAAAFVVVRG